MTLSEISLPASSDGARASRRPANSFWLNALFWNARHAPWLLRISRPFFLGAAWRFSSYLRDATLANARRLLGPDSTEAERTALARSVIENFYQFVEDIGRALRRSRDDLLAGIDLAHGREAWRRVRSPGRGAIVVTAHLGAFEVGMAALAQLEPRVHVVFHRDAFARFEELRAALRRHLGVREAAVGEGLPVWLRLREALRADEVVVMQADRVLPGQKGRRISFLGGHILMPSGPARLAALSGAPMIPTFAVRGPNGRIRFVIEEPIRVEQDEIDDAMLHLGAVIERNVRAYPGQWLMLERVWLEDRDAERDGEGGR